MFQATWATRPRACAARGTGLLCAIAWLSAGSAQGATFELERAVEAPPAVFAYGPSQTGATHEMTLPTPHDVDVWCRLALGGPPRGRTGASYYWGCYDERFDLVVLVARKAWPSAREWDENRAHEWAHARGWRHNPDGRGTDWARSLPVPRSQLALNAARAPD